LHPEEQELLGLLLSSEHPFPGQAELRAQLPYTRVDAVLANGNPTVYLDVDRSRCTPAPVRTRVPVSAQWPGPDGYPCEVLVHVVEGYLTELELFCYGDEPLRSLPASAELTIFL